MAIVKDVDSIFKAILERQKELEYQIKNPPYEGLGYNDKEQRQVDLCLKVRHQELGHLLNTLGYEEYVKQTESLDELFEEYLQEAIE